MRVKWVRQLDPPKSASVLSRLRTPESLAGVVQTASERIRAPHAPNALLSASQEVPRRKQDWEWAICAIRAISASNVRCVPLAVLGFLWMLVGFRTLVSHHADRRVLPVGRVLAFLAISLPAI